MKTHRSSFWVISIMLGLVLGACNMPSASNPVAVQGNATPVSNQPTSTPTAQINTGKPVATQGNTTQVPNQATSIPTAQNVSKQPNKPTSSSACSNTYFPTTPGATWTYANTSPQAPASITTRTITDVSPTGFVTHDAITPDIVVTIKWKCDGGNLTMLESATVSTASVAMTVSSASATGFLIPAVITVGKTWSEKLGMNATGDINGTQRMIQQNDTQIACTADGKESIQVQAGKFDALKVTCVYNIATITNIDGNPGKPLNNTINITDWYVSGVGSVKTEKSGDITETHVLTSYSIP